MTSTCNRSTKVSSHLYFDAGVDEREVESSSGELRDRCWTHSRPLQSADLAGEGDPLRGGRNAMKTWGRCQRGSTRSRGWREAWEGSQVWSLKQFSPLLLKNFPKILVKDSCKLFWTFRKKLNAKKKSSKFSKNSSKSFKNSIICQLNTDFLLKNVLKVLYFAQKFAQT